MHRLRLSSPHNQTTGGRRERLFSWIALSATCLSLMSGCSERPDPAGTYQAKFYWPERDWHCTFCFDFLQPDFAVSKDSSPKNSSVQVPPPPRFFRYDAELGPQSVDPRWEKLSADAYKQATAEVAKNGQANLYAAYDQILGELASKANFPPWGSGGMCVVGQGEWRRKGNLIKCTMDFYSFPTGGRPDPFAPVYVRETFRCEMVFLIRGGGDLSLQSLEFIGREPHGVSASDPPVGLRFEKVP
jgi:hypothetical protein